MRHTRRFTIEIGRCLTFDCYYCEPEKTTLLKSQNDKESSHKINTIDVVKPDYLINRNDLLSSFFPGLYKVTKIQLCKNELLVYAQHDQQFIDISVLEIPAQEKCLFPSTVHETLANETWNFVVVLFRKVKKTTKPKRKRLGASVLARKGQIILVENIRFVRCGKSR